MIRRISATLPAREVQDLIGLLSGQFPKTEIPFTFQRIARYEGEVRQYGDTHFEKRLICSGEEISLEVYHSAGCQTGMVEASFTNPGMLGEIVDQGVFLQLLWDAEDPYRASHLEVRITPSHPRRREMLTALFGDLNHVPIRTAMEILRQLRSLAGNAHQMALELRIQTERTFPDGPHEDIFMNLESLASYEFPE